MASITTLFSFDGTHGGGEVRRDRHRPAKSDWPLKTSPSLLARADEVIECHRGTWRSGGVAGARAEVASKRPLIAWLSGSVILTSANGSMVAWSVTA